MQGFKKFLSAAFIMMFAVLFSFQTAGAQERVRLAGIVATVNDAPITANDLDQRVRIALLASGLPDNNEVKRSLVPRVLRNLIDDRLKDEEIKKANLTVTDEEIQNQLVMIARNNNETVERLVEELQSKGISLTSFKDQIRTEIAWGKYVEREIVPRINISDSEIDIELNKFKRGAGQDQYRVAEIFIDVNRNDNEGDARDLANRLVQQLKNGTPFQALARQFSNSSSAATNGDLGWIFADSFHDEKMASIIRTMNKGELQGPIRTESGYYILFLIDKRKGEVVSEARTIVNLKKLFSTEKVSLENARTKIKGCLTMEAQFRNFSSDKTGNINNVVLENLKPDLRRLLTRVAIAETSSPVEEDSGYAVYMICRKTFEGGGNLPSRESVYNALGQQRLELRQRQFLSTLRNNAFIDIRL